MARASQFFGAVVPGLLQTREYAQALISRVGYRGNISTIARDPSAGRASKDPAMLNRLRSIADQAGGKGTLW